MAVEREVIGDDDDLYRRLARHHVKENGQVSSSAFKRGKDPDPEVSVNRRELAVRLRVFMCHRLASEERRLPSMGTVSRDAPALDVGDLRRSRRLEERDRGRRGHPLVRL